MSLMREAIHEAGHCVVARRLGSRVVYAQVGHLLSLCDIREADKEKRVMFTLAGGIAEQEFDFDPPYGVDGDLDRLSNYLFFDMGHLERHVRNLVREYKDVIWFVAVSLLEEGKLSGAQLDHIIRTAP